MQEEEIKVCTRGVAAVVEPGLEGQVGKGGQTWSVRGSRADQKESTRKIGDIREQDAFQMLSGSKKTQLLGLPQQDWEKL